MELSEVRKSIEESLSKMDELIENLKKEREKIKEEIDKKIEELQLGKFNKEEIENFLEEPYVIIPKRENEFYVIAPRWIDFQIGWLERQTKSYNIFIVNRYVQWIAPIPEALREKLKFPKPLPLKVVDGFLLTGKELQDEVFKKYRNYLSSREGSDRIRIKRGAEFKLISQLIEDGILPFIPKPVQEEDLRDWNGFELRSYQKDAWKEFLEKGACGIYWAFGSGKSFFGIYALARIKGEKLVVVPTLTLKEQWEERIEKYIPEFKNEIEVITYHAYEKVRNKEFSLICFDECQHLPSNTFIRLATLKTKYRLGFSGCIAKDTQILVKNSWKPIQMISPKEMIIGIKERPFETQVENIWKSDWLDKKPYLIETLSGRKIKLTDDHPILTINGWKKAKEIKEGDLVICYNEIPLEEKYLPLNIEDSIRHPKKTKIKLDINRIKNNGKLLAKLLGFAIGDSNLYKDYRLTFTVSFDEVNSIKNALDKLGLDSYVLKKKGRNAYNIRVRSYNFGRILNFLGMPIGNKRYIELKVPKWIYNYGLEREFLSGLWGAEGSPSYLRLKKNVHKSSIFFGDPILALNTKDESLLKSFFDELVKLHKKLGIDTKYRIIDTKEGSKKFELRVSERLENIIKFSHLIEFSFSPDKQKRNDRVLNYALIKERFLNERMERIRNNDKTISYSTRNDWRRGKRKFVELRNVEIKTPPLPENFRLEKVIKSSYLEDKFVIFDLRVPETENFIANGFITHNSPFREDKRENYIFALTGFPLGMSWDELLKLQVVRKPVFKVYLLETNQEKLRKLEELLKLPLKTIIFCDSIEFGQKIASKFGLPFVFGETRERMDIIRQADTCVVSRVGDEGISLPDLERVIEVSFLYGSRMQESQRFGRLMHASKEEPEHIILMTEEEFEKYQKRLYAITERGFRIELIR